MPSRQNEFVVKPAVTVQSVIEDCEGIAFHPLEGRKGFGSFHWYFDTGGVDHELGSFALGASGVIQSIDRGVSLRQDPRFSIYLATLHHAGSCDTGACFLDERRKNRAVFEWHEATVPCLLEFTTGRQGLTGEGKDGGRV